MDNEVNKVQLVRKSVDIDSGLDKRLKLLAINTGRSQKKQIEFIITEYFKTIDRLGR